MQKFAGLHLYFRRKNVIFHKKKLYISAFLMLEKTVEYQNILHFILVILFSGMKSFYMKPCKLKDCNIYVYTYIFIYSNGFQFEFI